MEPLTWIIALAGCGVCAWRATRALTAGVTSWGNQSYRRDESVSDFWFYTLWYVAGFFYFVIVVGLFLLSGEVPKFPVSALLFTPLLLYWLIQSLRTGWAGFRDLRFAREDEAKEYWALVVLNAAGLWLVGQDLFRGIADLLTS